ncbi:MFS transporter [Erwinia piriflorinigrans]|uniref:Putative sugar efflux transporter n=1 Tax=Erwinia piriflorinigrans CFBP 5888 TaxID=1161919 RepID=V5ZCJ1_9GAMM|nr:MFS transporter [Erwinia piriflorinigrans]CCG88669.1 putative sugar efflux transporter [Erwinia piriflorinigrans CFBP 5888]
MPLALWALAIGAFGIGTTEFIIAGLLPVIANEFSVSIPVAGNLATSYALGVFVGAPALIILGSKIPRKAMLVFLMGLFVAGNLITAFAPTLGIAIVGRVVTSMTHGAFFGIGSIIAAEMVAPSKRVQAISFMFMGLTVANLIGVPVGTWIGQHLSWRTAFSIIAVIGVVTIISVAWLIPHQSRPENQNFAHEFNAFRNVNVLLAMGITILGPGAFFTSITYIAPMMTELAGYSASSITWLMLLFGLGLFMGNQLGGRYADRALMPMLYFTLAAQAVVLFVFNFTAHSQIMSAICIFLMAAFGFATVSPIQKLVMDKARAAGAPTLASAVNIGLFNLGNALGAWLGGLVIAAGFGLNSPNWAGAILSVGALILAVISGATDKTGHVVGKSANEHS